MSANYDDIASLLVQHAPEVIDAHPVYGRTSGRCLLSTRVAVDVLRYFGVAARPVAVAYEAANAETVEVLRRDACGKHVSYEEALALGAWSVVTETDPTLGRFGYPGHLVAVTESELIDLDIVQVSRPELGILPPRAARFELASEFWEGAALSYALGRGGRITYQRLQRPLPWHTSPDWKRRGRSAPLTGAVIRRIRSVLDGAQSESNSMGATVAP